MNTLTAAHKTLPIPTYVKVTNLDNHKSIVVKVQCRHDDFLAFRGMDGANLDFVEFLDMAHIYG